VRYETELSSTLGFYAQSDLSYRGSSTYSFNDENAFNATLDSSLLWGAQIGIRNEKFDLGIYARNLTNEVAVFGLDASPDGQRVFSAEPRTIGAKISARF
jgi:outer membrane receptor protein involved in Fe transport